MVLRMEATPFELTPAQKDLLESLAHETGKAILALLDEALEELKAHVRQHAVNGEPHSGDGATRCHRLTRPRSQYGSSSSRPSRMCLTRNWSACPSMVPPSMTTISMVSRNVLHEMLLCRHVLLDCPLQSAGPVAPTRGDVQPGAEGCASIGYALKAGQLTYDCRYSTIHGMPVTGGRGFRGLKPLWYNGVPP